MSQPVQRMFTYISLKSKVMKTACVIPKDKSTFENVMQNEMQLCLMRKTE